MKKRYVERAFIVAVAALIIAMYPRFSSIEVSDVLSFTPESPFLAAVILLGLFCLKIVVMFIPLLVLFISAGIMFPVWQALLLCCLGLVIEMTAGYIIGRHIGFEKLLEKVERNLKVKKFLTSQRHTGPSVCFFASFLPFPLELSNMFMGAIKAHYLKFIVFMLIGLAPLYLPGVFLGSSITTPLSKQFLVPFVICVAANASIYVLYRIRSNKQ